MDCKSSARWGSYHFPAGKKKKNCSPQAVSLGHSTLCSSHTHRSASPEAAPAASSQLQVTNHQVIWSKPGSWPPPASQPASQKVRHQLRKEGLQTQRWSSFHTNLSCRDGSQQQSRNLIRSCCILFLFELVSVVASPSANPG